MKNYLFHIISLLLSASLVGCTGEDLQTSFDGNGDTRTLTLTLSHAGMESRAELAGDDDLNENAVSRVDVFLYPTDGEGSNALFSQEDIAITKNLTSSDNTVTMTLEVPMETVESLFPSNATQCTAYAIVNRPETGSDIPTNTDITSLKAIAITAGFDVTTNGGVQSEFVMDGKATDITWNKTAETISGNIPVERSAAKISLTIADIVSEIEDGGTWTPQTNDMRVLFYNGVEASQIEASAYTLSNDDGYFSIIGSDARSFTSSAEDNKTTYTQSVPFYSYPSDWGSRDDKEAHLILMLPWKKDGSDAATNFYYKVPIDNDAKKLVRNTFYQINLTVGILGSTELNDETVTLTPSCILLDWGIENISAELNKPAYLVVDEKNVIMNNQNSVSVSYESSDAVTAVITSIARPDYSSETSTTTTYYSGEGKETVDAGTNSLLKECKVEVNSETREIVLTHELVNDRSLTNYDYVPYTITVKVTNESRGFTENITYTQYPALYVVADYNEGGDTQFNNKERGYVMVNTLYASREDYSNGESGSWQTVEGFDSSSRNPNMYIITTGALDATYSSYILSDSREMTAYTGNQLGFTPVTDVNGRTLTYYYPTKTDNRNYLSPKFRISSAYGQLGNNTLSHADAKKRCAAYQEAGFPAGRWRLATTAELEYIIVLCDVGALPESLFGGSNYWTATHYCSVNTSSGQVTANTPTSNTEAYLRCVYDDWRWGSEPTAGLADFTWGDEERQ